MDIKLRLAAPSDAARLLRIYRPYVETTTVTFEYVTPTEEEFRARILEYSAEFPYIVCECDGTAVGYAYAHRYKTRFSYRFAAELSIYLDTDFCGKGIGGLMYAALIELLSGMGYKNLYGTVTDPNPASCALHKRFGFYETGREHKVGYKFGNWIDVIIFERIIADKNESASPALWNICPLSIRDIPDLAEEVLRKYEKIASSV